MARVKLTILKPAKIYSNPDNLKLSWTGCATGYRKRKDTMKGKRVYSRIDLISKIIPKVLLCHSRLRKSKSDLAIANPVMQILVTWTGQQKKNTKCSWSYFLLESQVLCLNFKANTFEKGPAWGINSVNICLLFN